MTSSADLAYTSASEAIGLFTSKELAPRELLEAVVARTGVVEPSINAFTDTYFDQAFAAAEAAADAYAKGTNRPLEGIPLAVKDEPRIAGQRTTQGSLLFADDVADATDPIADRVIEAGAIVHARTAAPEFSMAAVTWSFLHGITRTPWNLEITCGGSSGGSGASLAAGTSTLATGSDIGGSIRIPAAMNGLVGFKPPWGRVPEYWPWNREPYAASGPLARSVADSVLFQNVISGPLTGDLFSLGHYELPTPVRTGRGMRVAVSDDLGFFRPEPDVLAALAEASATLQAAGIEVEPVDLDWTDEARAVATTHLSFQARAVLMAQLPAEGSDRLTPYIQELLAEEEVSVADWQQSWRYGDHMYAELQRTVFDAGFDALICPTSVTTDIPADLGHPDTGQPMSTFDSLEKFMTYPFNTLGRLPVMSIPIGLAPATGVPIGMQIVGPVNDDIVPYRIAASFEAERGNFFHAHRPRL